MVWCYMLNMSDAYWEHFHHAADIGVRGIGATVEEAFEQTALALTAVISDPASVRPELEVIIQCSAPNPELLLTDWLNVLVYEMATRRMLFGRFRVKIEGDRLQAEIAGERIDLERHQPAVEIKGATYTELFVGQEPDGTWRAQCVVDV
jgi:SHS2 domain-containing protein